MRRGLAWIAALALAVAIVEGISRWIARPRVPEPPSIDTLGDMDPEVATLLRELRATIEGDSSDAGAWSRFAMACEANGFVGAARFAYETSVQLAPNEPRWSYRLALVRSRLGDHDAALTELTRTNDLEPSYGPAWCRRGLWLLDRGNADGAEAAFNRALAIDRTDLCASTGLARAHLSRRDNKGAVDALENVLERHPGDRYALQLLGTAYRRLGRIDDASFALAVGAGGEPTWRDPWSEEIGQYRRGFAILLKTATADAMAGRFDRALPTLERLRARNPGDVTLTNHTAEVLTASGRAGEAIRVLTPVVDARADNADTHLALASAHLALSDLGRATVHADRAIALNAAGARAFELKGMSAWRAGRPAEAAELFERGLSRDPRHVKLLAWIGFIHLEARRPHDAATAFMEVIRRDPLQADALAGLAMAQHALGAAEEAALSLARAEQVAAGHPRVREARAVLHAARRR